MSSLLLEVWYLSLKGILEKLQEHEEVKASEHLSERIHTALLFLGDAGKLVETANQEVNELRTKLSECLDMPKDHIEAFQALLPHYENMVKAGATPEFIVKMAFLEEIDIVSIHRLVRNLFQLSLEESQDLIAKVKKSS
jgi:hypothetical protein